MAPHWFPVKAHDRPKERTPEDDLVEDDVGGDKKSSCCVTVHLHFGPSLSICYSKATASSMIPIRVMDISMTDAIKCCFLSVCGAWRENEKRSGIHIPLGIKNRGYCQLINFLFGHAHIMKFSHLLVPSLSFCVWEYNYSQNAYSSFCLPAAYSVRFIRPWSGRDEEPVSVSICQSAWLSVCLPLRLSWIRQQVT